MAKYYAYDNRDSVVKMVDEIASELDLDNYIDFQVLAVQSGKKAKEVVKIVKANEFTEVVTDRTDLVFVIVYEDAFNLVEEDMQRMWLRMEMDKVSYDSEKDKINIGCPCVTVPIGMAEKYGNTAIDAAKLAIYTISQLADKAKHEKKNK